MPLLPRAVEKLQPRTIELLRQVKDVLKTGHPEHGFNMQVYNEPIGEDLLDMSIRGHECGTVMCISGWMNHFGAPDKEGIDHMLDDIGYHIPEIKADVLTLDILFLASDVSVEGDYLSKLTPTQAIAAIEQFITTDGEKAWRGIA